MLRCTLIISGICFLFGCGGLPVQTNMQQQAQSKASLKQKQSLQQEILNKGLLCPTNTGNYQVGAEDLLEVNIYGQEQLNRVVRVDREGIIKLPLIGEAKVQGLSTTQIERQLERLYRKNYLQNPQVTVFVKEYRHQRVSVVGAVNKPGIYPIIGPRTVFEMLSEAGGLKDDAGDLVHIIRKSSGGTPTASLKGADPGSSSPQTLIINMRSALGKGGAELCSLPIQDGDVLNVPYAGYAYVTGEVQKPGKVAVKQGLTVTQALAIAGPFTPVASNQVQILRFDDQGERQVIPVDLQAIAQGAGDDLLLNEDDVVVVPPSTGKKIWQGIASIFRGAFSVGYYAAP